MTCVSVGSEGSRTRELTLPPRPCHHTGMDTSTAPEPKIMLALTLRYAEDNEEAAMTGLAEMGWPS